MRVLVTGGAGYLGSTLVEYLLRDDHMVTVIDNFMYRQMSLAHLCHNPNLEIVRGDARDMDLMQVYLRSADVLIPLAALVGKPICDILPFDAQSTNVNAIHNTLRLMSPHQRVLIPISNSGYGIGEKDAYCDEDSPLNPVSLYGRTKVAAEAEALDRGNAISLRLATVFGMSPRMRVDLLVNDFTMRAIRDGSLTLFEGHFRRNFVHVRDVAVAFVHTINRWDEMIKTPIYNVGNTALNITKTDLCEIIAQHVPGFQAVIGWGEDPDKRDYNVSNARMEATGWAAAWDLHQGVEELMRGYSMLRAYEHGNI